MGLSLHQLCLQQNRYLRLCGQWQNRPQAFQVQFPLRTQTQSKGDHFIMQSRLSLSPAIPQTPAQARKPDKAIASHLLQGM